MAIPATGMFVLMWMFILWPNVALCWTLHNKSYTHQWMEMAKPT